MGKQGQNRTNGRTRPMEEKCENKKKQIKMGKQCQKRRMEKQGQKQNNW